MTPKEFDDQMRDRVKTIHQMAKVDIMGARREVDQLRREFVTALASSEGQWIPLGLWREMAIEIEELDKFDMPPESKRKRKTQESSDDEYPC